MTRLLRKARPWYLESRNDHDDRSGRRAGEMDGRKKRGGEIPRAAAIWILSALILASIAPVSSMDDRCAACNAVAAELEIGLSNEKPRNHLDMRHRLDSRGQREGKVIDYKVSELRVVELLDGLCEKMQDYTLMKLESGTNEWVKVRDWDALKADKQEARAHSKKLSSFCGRLLEETEDELAELIKQGSAEPGGVNKALCQDLSKHCSSSRGSSNMDDREL